MSSSASSRVVVVRVAATGATLAHADLAATPWRRLRGLLGRKGLTDGEGMVIDPCSGVHTCFMTFPIDVLFVNRDGLIVRVVERMTPFRFASGGRGAARTIELPEGTIRRAGLRAGVALSVEPA